MSRVLVVGQYLYTAGPSFFGDKVQIERHVLLEWDKGGYAIGSSKMPESRVHSGPACFKNEIPQTYFDTPEEALAAYKVRREKWLREQISEAEATIRESKAELAALKKLKLEHTKRKQYEDDWIPRD